MVNNDNKGYDINEFNNIPITSITPFSLLDYPDQISCILWFLGCNFKCRYCYNIDFIRGIGKIIPFQQLNSFLESRKTKLDSIVLSGGECTIYKNFVKFVRYLKTFGYKIKIDTNGSNPKVIEELISNNLVDYIAMDYKSPLDRYGYISGYQEIENICASLKTLINSNIHYEIRTTVHTDLLNEDHINDIIKDLDSNGYTGSYYIQNFKDGPTIDNLPPQKRNLNINKLASPSTIKLKFRNFC